MVDDALVEAVSDDIEQVYRTEAQKIWRALLGYSGDRQIADDAVAEAFARALHHRESINDLRAWLWRVAPIAGRSSDGGTQQCRFESEESWSAWR